MKKLFLVSLLLLAGSTWAEWKKFHENEESTSYIDYATVKSNGVMRKAWIIGNIKEADSSGVKSWRVMTELDFVAEKFRVRSATGFEREFAKGVILLSNDSVSNWSEIPPQTNQATLLRIVCAK